MAVGVLALQGDVREHIVVIEAMGEEAVAVKRADQIDVIDALVIPGGESTTIGLLAERFGLVDPLREAITGGLPTLGTCAGMIVLAVGTTEERDQVQLGVLDVVVRRNAFGRQDASFEAEIQVRGVDDGPVHGVFIRAPWIEKHGSEVEVLASVDDHPVMVRQGSILATSFHPELVGEPRVHEMLLEMS